MIVRRNLSAGSQYARYKSIHDHFKKHLTVTYIFSLIVPIYYDLIKTFTYHLVKQINYLSFK